MMAIDSVAIARRLAEVDAFAARSVYLRQKHSALDSFAAFCESYLHCRLGTARPVDVCAWMAWRENGPKVRTVIHVLNCPSVGSPSNDSCDCPKQMKASALRALVSQLSNAFREIGGRFVLPWVEVEGNPADSLQVRTYVRHCTQMQKRVGVTTQKALPILEDKLRLLIRCMRNTLRNPFISNLERLCTFRDLPWFLIAFWFGIRGKQVANTLVQNVRWDTENDRLLILHSQGKTLRDMDATESFAVSPARDDPELCPIAAMKAYLQAARLYVGTQHTGYVFPDFVMVDGIITSGPHPIDTAKVNRRLQHHLDLYGLREMGESLKSFRAGCAVSNRIQGQSAAESQAYIGWRTDSMEEHYSSFAQVARMSGISEAVWKTLPPAVQQKLYHRINRETYEHLRGDLFWAM